MLHSLKPTLGILFTEADEYQNSPHTLAFSNFTGKVLSKNSSTNYVPFSTLLKFVLKISIFLNLCFHIDMERGSFGETSFLNIKPENDEFLQYFLIVRDIYLAETPK